MAPELSEDDEFAAFSPPATPKARESKEARVTFGGSSVDEGSSPRDELSSPTPPSLGDTPTAWRTSVENLNTKAEKRSNCQTYWIIDPIKSRWLSYWDGVTTMALGYTALVTPWEVAFVPNVPFSERGTDTLFLLNRLVDIIFIFDMLLQFRVAVKLTDTGGTRWVRDPKEVALRYVQGVWFWIDLFSVSTSIFDLLPMEDASSFTVLRAVRVLRLFKLVRLLRGSRIFKKWELRMSINYAYLSVFNITGSIFICCHWIACVWGLQASFDRLGSWYYGFGFCIEWGNESQAIAQAMTCPDGYPDCEIGLCSGGTCSGGSACVDASNLYSTSLYFAVMTITSVGYGDVIPQPLNAREQIICSIIMLVSGMLWGYLIGTFCGLAASLSPSVQAFREDLSQLNSMMSIYALPGDMRYRLREYIHETQHLRNTEARNALLSKLSPAMQSEVQLIVNQKWISRIWYLERAETELCIEISFSLSALVFPPREFCPFGFMYIVQRGHAFHLGKIRREGAVWGDDVVLDDPELQINIPAIAVTYLWVYTINGEKLNNLIRNFPRTARRLGPVKRRLRCRRAIVRAAERRCYQMGVPFRGRLRPIYARDVREALDQESLRNRHSVVRPLAAPPPASPAHSSSKSPLVKSPTRYLSSRSQSRRRGSESRTISEDEVRQVRLAAQNVGMNLRLRQMGVAMAEGTDCSHHPSGRLSRGNSNSRLTSCRSSNSRTTCTLGRHDSSELPAATPGITSEQVTEAVTEALTGAVGPLEERVSSMEDKLGLFGLSLARIEAALERAVHSADVSAAPAAVDPDRNLRA